MRGKAARIGAGLGAVLVLALGGAAMARATGVVGDDEGGSLSAAEVKQASAAALAATGGGTVNATERDGEDGATFEVEVTQTDGKTVDVRLDDVYRVVVIEGDVGNAGEEPGQPG
jgi:hypothetical protein